ncbi:sulfite oxidase [Piscinibacter koreensis]|uniref:Sulfite oxidase n=1 Tax=Piscinibacter koreensis TaxID=2742824 RepID=A0A7Y6NLS8_9BURK|nr:sulfite oxidase [Schlegelella koreensis]NUZ05487.1 sulfite oxidase [Schlegelella koreensis]
MSTNDFPLRRRQLLAGSASALAASGLATFTRGASAQTARPFPPNLEWKDPANFIVHNARELETKRSAFGTSAITPAERLFVRANLPTPDPSIVADRDAWTVSIEGVRNPRTLSIRELKAIGIETTTSVLQCSGNGRGFFPSKPTGAQWTVGASGCVVWSGVPIRYLVDALGGLDAGVQFITGTGGEKLPEGVDPLSVVVERSVPLRALPDALLAWEMNGAPLPLIHGGPLRLIAPGFQGINNVKYIKRLAFSATESKARIQQLGYRMAPLGGKADPSQPSVYEMGLNSWVNGPGADGAPVKAGTVWVHGVAFSGGTPIRKVEVSTNGGRDWLEGNFIGPDLGRFAWRQFALPVKMAPGTYQVTSRATDASGAVQVENRVENLSGYNNTSWRDHIVAVTVA